MQVNNLKLVNAQVAYRIDSINFGSDGAAYINIQVGTLTGPADNKQFTPIANQSHHLTQDEMAAITVEVVDAEPLRDVVERAIEAKLREKGVLII